MLIPAYPLQWPISRDRTKAPEMSTYSIATKTAYEYALKRLSLLGVRNIIISSNAILKKDGLPSGKQPKIKDVGVSAWFQWSRTHSTWYCISCDSFNSIAANLRAIGLSVTEIRNITRRLNISLIHTFAATPPQPETRQKPPPRREPPPKEERKQKMPYWCTILSVNVDTSWPETKRAYYRLAKSLHPDKGGNSTQFQELSRAYVEAKRYFDVK